MGRTLTNQTNKQVHNGKCCQAHKKYNMFQFCLSAVKILFMNSLVYKSCWIQRPKQELTESFVLSLFTWDFNLESSDFFLSVIPPLQTFSLLNLSNYKAASRSDFSRVTTFSALPPLVAQWTQLIQCQACSEKTLSEPWETAQTQPCMFCWVI